MMNSPACTSGSRWQTWFSAFLIVFAVRIAWIAAYRSYAVFIKHSIESQDNAFENGDIAKNVLAGKGFYMDGGMFPAGPTAEKPPLYPLLLALHMRLFGPDNFLPLRLFQAALMSVAILVVMRLFAAIFDAATGVISGLLLSLSPVLAKADAYVENMALAIFFASLFFFYFWNSLKEKSPAPARAGLFMGLTGLTNPSFVPFFALSFLILFFNSSIQRWRKCVLMALPALLVISPWTLRNRVTFHQWIPINTNFPFNIWMGSNPQATGALTLQGGESLPVPADLLAKTRDMNEAQMFSYFGRIGWQYAREHPARFLILRVKAYFYFWMTSRPWLGYGKGIDWINVSVAALMLASALAGFRLAFRVSVAACWVFGLLFLSYASVYGLTHADSIDRYRLPLDPFLLGFSAYWVKCRSPWLVRILESKKATTFYTMVEN